MRITRRHVAAGALALAALPAIAYAESADEAAVNKAVDDLNKAMIAADRAKLEMLTADAMSYGHSAGKVDTKTSFINDLMDGKSDFVTIAITEQTIKVIDNVAIVRHTLTADTNDSGKPGKVSIKILGVWQQQGAGGDWKLIARQAVRPPQ